MASTASTRSSRPAGRGSPRPRRPRGCTKTAAYLHFLTTLAVVVGILYLAKPILVPLALAVLLTFVLTPLVKAGQRRGLGRLLAVLLVVSLALLIFAGVGWVVGAQVTNLAAELPKHTDRIKEKIAQIRGSSGGPLTRLVDMFHQITLPPPNPTGAPAASSARASAGPEKEKQVVVARMESSGPLEKLTAAAAALLEPVATAGLVLILVIFMLVKREDLRNRVIGLLGHGRLTGATRVIVDSASRLSKFLLMQLCINTAFGVCFALALWVIGVRYWFLWGFLSVLLRFIPYVGSWMAALLPVVLSFAIAPSLGQPLLVVIAFVVLELLTANVAEPLLFGHSTGVSPLALLVAAAFWAWVWGPIGLVLSTPLTVCLVVIGQHVPRLKFLSLLLGDQPALSADVNYYQRLLAGDAVEAAQVAEQYAAANGADHVPDEVFIPALRLARRDREHAGLTAEDETFIYATTEQVLAELTPPSAEPAAAEPAAAPPEGGPRLLACPAHHRAEELSLRMLAGPARPAGCDVEVVPTRTLPVEIEAQIEREKPALLVVAVVPPGGVVQARYLCRRLRRRFADLRIIVCYLGRVGDYDRLLVRLRAAGASYVTTSLLQTRTQVQALLPASPSLPPTNAPLSVPLAGDEVPLKTAPGSV